jgi:hypothetical protein
MLLALMEIRAPSPDQLNGLEGLGTKQVWKAPVRLVTHHRRDDLRNHGEMIPSPDAQGHAASEPGAVFPDG